MSGGGGSDLSGAGVGSQPTDYRIITGFGSRSSSSLSTVTSSNSSIFSGSSGISGSSSSGDSGGGFSATA